MQEACGQGGRAYGHQWCFPNHPEILLLLLRVLVPCACLRAWRCTTVCPAGLPAEQGRLSLEECAGVVVCGCCGWYNQCDQYDEDGPYAQYHQYDECGQCDEYDQCDQYDLNPLKKKKILSDAPCPSLLHCSVSRRAGAVRLEMPPQSVVRAAVRK